VQDIKQEMADVARAIEQLQAQPAPVPAGAQKVTLRHPHTGDTKVVDAVTEQIVPLLVRGYVQSPAAPAEGE